MLVRSRRAMLEVPLARASGSYPIPLHVQSDEDVVPFARPAYCLLAIPDRP